jgi:hypothetical protein
MAASGATAASTAVPTAAAAAACPQSQLYAWVRISEIVFVKEVERRQADVRDFLVIESGELKRRATLPESIGY